LTPIWLEDEDVRSLPKEVLDAHQRGETAWDLRRKAAGYRGFMFICVDFEGRIMLINAAKKNSSYYGQLGFHTTLS
jgi:hypothetical protein